MGKSQHPRGSVALTQGSTFCCDADTFVNLRDAGLLLKLRVLVKGGSIKVPEGVFRELKRKTDKLAKTLQKWNEKYGLVVNLDYKSLELLPEIERKYGDSFNISGKIYRGFWKSASGRKSADSQVVALAKAHGWIVISNDDSVHGACMLEEDVICRRWEEIGRLLLRGEGSQQLTLM